jgi:hypothetical protein
VRGRLSGYVWKKEILEEVDRGGRGSCGVEAEEGRC